MSEEYTPVDCEVASNTPKQLSASELLANLFSKPKVCREEQVKTAMSWMVPWDVELHKRIDKLMNERHAKRLTD